METIDELTVFVTQTAADGARGRLQARGEARAIIRRDGVLPDDAPAFGNTIDTDLAEYALSLLRASMALREAQGDPEIWRKGFARAGNAFEALVQNGAPEDVTRGFYRIAGAASYHLASYSALAFSLIAQRSDHTNFAPPEEALAFLILRDLNTLGMRARAWLLDPAHSDGNITRSAAEGELDPDDVVRLVVTTTIFRSLAFFEFALQTGVAALVEEARLLLRRAISLAKHANAVSLWWIARIALNLIDDLWASSLHQVLPVDGPAGAEGYQALRKLFIGELYSRRAAEVELWPSQREAAHRATDLTDDLVVALPTSAGKTRIAEIAALMALASGRRVLIVTPLRALSAQTERSFRKTFSSLGFTVSSLYGASGVAIGDEDALRSQDIVIATPEKLDFALRNDPTIIDDVGLVVLDEGHLIGPSEREIRYESLVQRLLRRPDNAGRRIVCLSAILPEGDQLNDLTAWIRSDAPGAPLQSGWRPTRQRFGTLSWQGNSGRLSFDLEAGGPYIRHFIPEQAAIRPRRTRFPRDNKELSLAAAWTFSAQGKRALIFCTQRDHVEGYAETIVDLNRRGYLPSLLEDAALVERALAVGREWLGPNHPAVQCLPIGVAIHHGRLPGPFLREVEALLSVGVLRVTVASPTLAQGLNLNAAVLLIPTLYRAGVPLSGEEFANVAGRAGRAFVDLEGLVLHVMHQPENWRLRAWRDLVGSSRARSLTSGIISIISEVITRLARTNVFLRADAMEYLANAQEAWFPQDQAGDTDTIESLIERLDATVFGLIEALDTDSADLPRLLDEALTGSLWARQIVRLGAQVRSNQLWVLWARASLIWNKSSATQRRATFAMGVGLEAGLAIDAVAEDLTALLDQADAAALAGNQPVLSTALVGMAERLFAIRPFVPDADLPGNWRDLLTAWLAGTDVIALGLDNMRVVEDAFVYRLVWAIEAVRMRRRANGGESEVIEGSAAATIEAGVPQTMMAMLVRAGLPSRVAAMTAIRETQPAFATRAEMNQWLNSNEIAALSDQPDWPTADTASIWKQFRSETLSGPILKWNAQEWNMQGPVPAFVGPAIPGRISIDAANGAVSVTTPDFKRVTGIQHRLRQLSPSLLHVEYAADGQNSRIVRLGRSDARWEMP
ncbi:DEAD/DEAH box helicase-like protein [Neorhizobium galegae bv. orientalis]|nr:DEAD/DEAH box helicase-like protein [Neorhizobium galegae bv. orientalis]